MPVSISENWIPMIFTAVLTAGITSGGVAFQLASQGEDVRKLEVADDILQEEFHAMALSNWTEDDQREYQKAHKEECQLVLGRIHEKLERIDEVLDRITEDHIILKAGK